MSAPTPSSSSFGSSGSGDYNLPALNVPSVPATSSGGKPAKKRTLLPEKMRPAMFTLGGFALLLVIIQAVNSLAPSLDLNEKFGLISRRVSGLDGIILAPLLHGSWGHLLANLVPLLIFGLLLFVGGVRQFVVVTVLVWLVSGIGVWVFGPSNTVTIGASGIVFGWLAYLVARGIFTRNIGQILIGAVLLFIWGSLFLGIFTTAIKDVVGSTGISWQAHLFGALGGVLAAFLVARADGGRQQVRTRASE
ncbi:rhomboid family intramembrane serine protease [Nakamurella lactea]|uniref:rhomboid family intramembrane serine protease n=1 Tax=Nakamurella lactea TaxID=459515 RepID=UPI0004033284|nr:rhomboid family intramembrane serine protease [Nakamurella lactea]